MKGSQAMYQQTKPIIAALIVVLAGMSPTLLAQNTQPNSAVGSSGADGKILWQYNTDG